MKALVPKTPSRISLLVILITFLASVQGYAQLSGAYTINAAGSGSANYTSFSLAATALSTQGVSGPVTFTVANGTYNEQVVIPATEGAITGASATNTITFDGGTGNAANVILSYDGTNPNNFATLTLNGCAWVTFTNITINNITTGNSGWGVNFLSKTVTNHNNQLLDCKINVPAPGDYKNIYGAIFTYGDTSSGTQFTPTWQTAPTNCKIKGCTISNGNCNIYLFGFSGVAGGTSGIVVDSNTLYNSYYCGILVVAGANALKLRGNNISSGPNSNTAGNFGIKILNGASLSSASDYTEISGNTIYHFTEAGLTLQTCPGSVAYHTKIFNNFIGGGIPSGGTFLFDCVYVTASTGYVDFWNNTLSLNQTGSRATSAAMEIASGTSGNWDIENNIFSYTGAGTTNGQAFYTNSGLLSIGTNVFDYNLFYNSATNNPVATVEGVAYTNSTLIGGGGFNTNSVVANPNFVNASSSSPDLHITAQGTKGVNIPAIAVDIDGQTRNNPPNVGADEIVNCSNPTAAGPITGTDTVCPLQTATYSVAPVSGATSYTWTLPAGYQIVGASNTNSITIFFSNIAQSGTISVAGKSNCGTGNASAAFAITVLPAAVAGTVTLSIDTICNGNPVKLTLSGNVGKVQWQYSGSLSNFINITGADSVAYFPIDTLSYYYRAIVSNGICSDTSSSILLTVLPAPTASVSITVNGLLVYFNANASGNVTSYYWDFGDDSLSNLANPNHLFTKDTTYNVCVTVYNNTGCSFTSCKIISLVDGVANVTQPENLIAYPNPVTDNLYINTDKIAQPVKSVEVYDVLGRMVYGKMINTPNTTTINVNVSLFAQGMYYVKVKTANASYMQQVVKQ